MPLIWLPAYIGIGSNLDDPAAQVNKAFDLLAHIGRCRLIARSRLYRSAPLGPQEQPEFVNAVAGLLTLLTSRELLATLQQLEAAMGRQSPVVRWGPRRIDLDLLVYATERTSEADLTVPHAGIPERNFVLYPLREIAPDLLVPGQGRVSDLAMRVGSAGLALIP